MIKLGCNFGFHLAGAGKRTNALRSAHIVQFKKLPICSRAKPKDAWLACMCGIGWTLEHGVKENYVKPHPEI